MVKIAEVSSHTQTPLTLKIQEFVTSVESGVTSQQILRVVGDDVALSATARTLLGLKDSFDNGGHPSSIIAEALRPEIDLSYRTLDNANFHSANLRNANFTGSSLRKVNFMGADLRGAKLVRTDVTDSQFQG
ncbi:MAG: hypothetical protein FD149_2244, partial [Rhodospirillaceae bacterium]